MTLAWLARAVAGPVLSIVGASILVAAAVAVVALGLNLPGAGMGPVPPADGIPSPHQTLAKQNSPAPLSSGTNGASNEPIPSDDSEQAVMPSQPPDASSSPGYTVPGGLHPYGSKPPVVLDPSASPGGSKCDPETQECG